MRKANVPATGEERPFSGEVPFPSVEMEFLDGLHVSLYPNSSMDHSIMGVHYVMHCRDREGQVAEIEFTFSLVRRDPSSEPGPEFERYIEFRPRRGKPLESKGKDYSFSFKAGEHASFVPRDNNYRISQLVPGGGYMIELAPYFLNCLRLFYEPPYKGSSEINL